MKTSFMKNFFNSKDMGIKNNFNIHSVDLDDSDDVIICDESFFQRNNSQNMKEILKNKFMKSDDTSNAKKTNLYTVNDSSSSISSCEASSPMLSNKFNLSKLRQSPIRSPLFENESKLKNQKSLEFVPPTSMHSVTKTPKREEKMLPFQSSKAKGLSSPSLKMFNTSKFQEANKNMTINGSMSPMNTKSIMLPSVKKYNTVEKDDCQNYSKTLPMFYRADFNEKSSPDFDKDEYKDKINKETEIQEQLNKLDSYNHIQPLVKLNFKETDEGRNHFNVQPVLSKNDMNEKSTVVMQNNEYKDKSVKDLDIYEDSSKNDPYNQIKPESLQFVNGYLSDKDSEDSHSLNQDADNNKLKVLHMKLKLESEKIQKWKVNIEKELSLKTKKISESDKIIESLRSSNLDLQMRQENISLNYREEIECRSEVSKKIENSRQLCNILKEKISELEEINQKYLKENENMKSIQKQILHVLNFVSDDIKNFSQDQFQSLTDLNNKIASKNIEIEKLNANLLEQIKSTEYDAEQYEAKIKIFNIELLRKDEDIESLKTKVEDLIVNKEEIGELLESIKKENVTLITEKTILIEELGKSKELYNILEVDNINLAKENENKQKHIDQLNLCLEELKLEYTQYKHHVNEANSLMETLLKDKEDIIDDLKSKLLILEKQIETDNEILSLFKEEVNIKVAGKDNSITNLNKCLLERDEHIATLENTISFSNNQIKDLTDSLNDLNLEKDAIVKTSSILKSSNQDLREELNNYKSEINEQGEEIGILKNQINDLKNHSKELKEELANYTKANIALELENKTLNVNLSDLKTKLNEITDVNNQLKATMIDLNDTNKYMLEGKLEEIKEITDKYDNLAEIRRKLDIELELKIKEWADTKSELNVERERNVSLIEKCEKLRISIDSKDGELTIILNEKNQLNEINSNLSKWNEDSSKVLKSYETVIIENKSKISSLESFVEDLSKDKQNILKSREDLRKELMFTLEQCKNENDVAEKKRNKEVENLKSQITSLTTNSSKTTKNSKNKINDLQNLISQQKEEIDNLRTEKTLIAKNVEVSSQSMKELNDKMIQKDQLLEESASDRDHLQSLICDYKCKIDLLSNDLNNKNDEISRFKEIEIKYCELRDNLLTNSPPMSTQIPNFIKTNASATPKTQRLSTRLSSINSANLDGQMQPLNDKQTPQKTPKGILRQPGSASKRRRVLFEDASVTEQSFDNGDDSSVLSDGVDIDLNDIEDDGGRRKEDRSPAIVNLTTTTTPKKTNLVSKLNLTDTRSTGRLNNIRKTPSKAPMKLSDKRKKDDKNWFDSDNFFGVNEP